MKKKLRIIVAGSREFNNYPLLSSTLVSYFVKNKLRPTDVEIVSGNARGGDKLGEYFADKTQCDKKIFKPNWSIGNQGGILRNIEMAEYSDVLFAFYDGVSTGTRHMIEIAKKKGLEVHVIRY